MKSLKTIISKIDKYINEAKIIRTKSSEIKNDYFLAKENKTLPSVEWNHLSSQSEA